ncbi:MAG TPA: serine hydrolase domain-containing protein [Thermomicrobiales bacterium]|nr:serine hydrolase domain-containing protein [Thermomicrobiales bacterium]
MLNIWRLEADIAARMAAARVPGLALAVVGGGEVIYARGFGVTSVEDGGLPVTPYTLFQIGSITKSLTGTLVMRLVDAGALDLDRPVTAYLPDLTLGQPDVAGRVTLRRLLSHTAGLPFDQITPDRLYGSRDPDALAAYVRDELPRRPLVAAPGARWSYSNPGIILAARVAEVVTGRTYPELLRELVCAPLVMARTTVDPTVALTYPLAQGHELAEDGALRVRHRAADNAAQYPAAFAYSTALDLANFALLHLGGGRFGGERVLTPASVAAMHEPHAARGEGPGTAYGLTFFLDDFRGRRKVGHPGSVAPYASLLALLPDEGLGVVLLCNRGDDFEAEREVIADAILADLL